MLVRFYERPGCHLCADALAVVEREVDAAPSANLERIDIDTDPELVARYGEFVPVVEIDGEPHSHWFVDAVRLRDALEA